MLQLCSILQLLSSIIPNATEDDDDHRNKLVTKLISFKYNNLEVNDWLIGAANLFVSSGNPWIVQ